jgi:hypothetical protein
MRRRLQRFFPVFLIALAIQMAAQIGAGWAAALAVSDPFASIPICHSSPATVPSSPDQGNDSGRDASCAACCVLNAGWSIDTPRPVMLVAPLHREVETVLRGYERSGLLAAPVDSNCLARGPPPAV